MIVNKVEKIRLKLIFFQLYSHFYFFHTHFVNLAIKHMDILCLEVGKPNSSYINKSLSLLQNYELHLTKLMPRQDKHFLSYDYVIIAASNLNFNTVCICIQTFCSHTWNSDPYVRLAHVAPKTTY